MCPGQCGRARFHGFGNETNRLQGSDFHRVTQYRSFVEPKLKAAILVRQLTFVNQQASFDLAAFHGLFDLVERHYYRFEVGLKETEDQVGGGELKHPGLEWPDDAAVKRRARPQFMSRSVRLSD